MVNTKSDLGHISELLY